MRQVRLLPIVIVAAAALLVLKSVGIMTGGGYVLTGTSIALAAGDAHSEGGDDQGGGEASAEFALPAEQILSDRQPTLDDRAPTISLGGDSAGGHGGGDAHSDAESHDAAEAGENDPSGADESSGAGAAPIQAAAIECPPGNVPRASLEASQGQGGGFNFAGQGDDCVPNPGVNEAGDALPIERDGAGDNIPLAILQGENESTTNDAILERLSTRRAELDQLEADLDIRLALVEAAEKRIAERTQILEQLEARINAMVDEKRALEEAQFTAVVAMYETMKPKDAAAIFDQLEMPVLLRVTRSINPRKMAPIMARMNPAKAKDLTAGLAVDQVEPTIDMAQSVNELPQIVGQ